MVAVNAPNRSPTAANLHAAVTTVLALDGHRNQDQPFAVWPVVGDDQGALVLRLGWLSDEPAPPGLLSCPGWRFGPLHTRTRAVTKSEITYAELAATPPSRRILFAVRSPMLFSSNGATVHLPTAWLMWRSLMHRWNQYCPEGLQLDPEAVEGAAHRARVDRFELESRDRVLASSPDGHGGWRERQLRGCVGTLEICPADEDDSALLTPLAGFAEVAGVGYMTTHGFGAVNVSVR